MNVITLKTPRGDVLYVPRDLTKWPRNGVPSTMVQDQRGMTVHWPGGYEERRYRNVTNFSSMLSVDADRVGDSIRAHNAIRDASGKPTHTDVGYNYFVGRSGVVFEGRGWSQNGANGALLPGIKSQYPNGATTSNPYWVSVQVIAGVDLPDLTIAQWEALKRFYTWVAEKAEIDNPRVNGHRDVRATACPGDVVHANLKHVAAAWPVTQHPEDDEDMKTLDQPFRLHDSRTQNDVLHPGEVLELAVMAVEVGVNITVVPVDLTPGFVTAWGAGDRPPTSNVNFCGYDAVANYARVRLDAGKMRIAVSGASCHVIVDVQAAG